MKKVFLALLFLVGPWVLGGRVWAQCGMGGSGGGHQHSPKQHQSEHQAPRMSHGVVKNYSVDGYGISFNIVEKDEFLKVAREMEDEEVAKHEGMMAGKDATHHLAAVISDGETGERLSDVPLKLKLINLVDKKETTKPWDWMDNHYCCYLNFDKPGEYVVLASFKADGQEHSVGFTYEFEKPKSEDVQGQEIYTCPMHPEIVRNKPGDCPICGMTLVKK